MFRASWLLILALPCSICAAPLVAGETDFAVSGALGGVRVVTLIEGDDLVPREGLSAQARASVAHFFTPTLGIQGDVLLGYNSLANDEAEDAKIQFEAAVHAFIRHSDNVTVGAFAQIGWDGHYNDVGYGGEPSVHFERHYLGVEGKVSFDASSVHVQSGWMQLNAINYDPNIPALGPFATATIRHFPSSDLSVEGRVGIFGLKRGESSVSHLTYNIGAGFEYRLPGSPLSTFLEYDYFRAQQGMSSPTDTHRVLAGLRFSKGAASLQDRDRSGAMMKPVEHYSFFP
jgi:hypothetical protein